MTQFIEPNKKSDLIAPRVLDWLQSLRTGLLSGFTVTAGSSGFKINIASGKVVINGTTVYDDETRTDSLILDTELGGVPGANVHAMIYVTYTYQDTYPPASMGIGCLLNTGSMPSSPALPADSVKIADIFIPSGANDLSTSKIVVAPTMPDRGNDDADTLIERVVGSNMNMLFTGGGAVTYDSGTDELAWTEDIEITAPVTTHRERYNSAPLTRGTIAAGTLAGVGTNALVFTVFDRANPLTDLLSPAALTAYVLDFAAPANPGLAQFFDPAKRDDIVFLGLVLNDVLIPRRELVGSLPVPVGAEPPVRFLRHDPAGGYLHQWSYLTSDMIIDIISISTFVADGSPVGSLVEKGDTFNNPEFTVAYANDTPVTTTLDDDFGPNSDAIVPATSNPVISPNSGFQKTDAGVDPTTTFTLKVVGTLSPTEVTKTTSIKWARRFYYGPEAVDPGAGNYDNAWLQALGNNPVTAGRSRRVQLLGGNAPVNEYVFFAYAAYHGGSPTVYDNISGFDVSSAFVEVDAAQAGITTENVAAIAETYRVFRSNNLQNGDVDVTVS